jgi:hypothetical protein
MSRIECPNCLTARVVRASIFDENFWTNLTLIALPLPVLGSGDGSTES